MLASATCCHDNILIEKGVLYEFLWSFLRCISTFGGNLSIRLVGKECHFYGKLI